MIPIVNKRSYELVRDRIAEILATELPSQSTLHSDSNLNADVFIDRIVPIDSNEVPLVNIIMGSANWDNFTQTKQDGNYVYDIDIYVGSKGSSITTGDVLSMNKLQKLTGVIQGILMHPQYATLGFARPFIEHREVSSASLGVPNNTLDATNTTQCRLQLMVRVPENSSVTIPNNIEGWSTQVKLGLTDKGYIYSGDNIPIPDPVCEVVTFVYNTENTLLAQKTVNANDNTIQIPNIQFTDSDSVVSSVPSGLDIVAKQCTPFEDATVTNTNNTYNEALGSGDNLIVPDSEVNVNGVLFDSLPATNDLNIEVYQSTGNTQIGAKQGQFYRIPNSLIQLDGADGLELVANLKATDGLILKITNEDLETIPQVYVDGNNLVVEDKGIFNSNNTFSQAIDYINDNILANVPNIDSDGSTVSTPAMIPFVCTPQAKDLFLSLNYKDDNDIIEVMGDLNNVGSYTTIPTDLTYSLDGSNYIAISNPFTIVNGTLYYFKRGTATVTEIKTFIGTYV